MSSGFVSEAELELRRQASSLFNFLRRSEWILVGKVNERDKNVLSVNKPKLIDLRHVGLGTGLI
jgi:hypothetical protein